jgi:hypothetical protein
LFLDIGRLYRRVGDSKMLETVRAADKLARTGCWEMMDSMGSGRVGEYNFITSGSARVGVDIALETSAQKKDTEMSSSQAEFELLFAPFYRPDARYHLDSWGVKIGHEHHH